MRLWIYSTDCYRTLLSYTQAGPGFYSDTQRNCGTARLSMAVSAEVGEDGKKVYRIHSCILYLHGRCGTGTIRIKAGLDIPYPFFLVTYIRYM